MCTLYDNNAVNMLLDIKFTNGKLSFFLFYFLFYFIFIFLFLEQLGLGLEVISQHWSQNLGE